MSVAVWLTNYGNEAYLDAAIQSVLNQSYGDLTLYVADNRSPGTLVPEIIERAQRDSRCRVIQPPPGPKLAGIPFAKHCWDFLDTLDDDYSIILGGHDEWRDTDFLLKMVQKMDLTRLEMAEKGRQVSIVYPDTWQLDFEGNLCSHYGEILQFAGGYNFTLLPQIVISTVSSPQLFGLWNEQVRRLVRFRHCCSGWDHLIVAEAALYGAILFEGRTQLLMRRPPTDDDLTKYGERHLDPELLKNPPLDFLQQLEWMLSTLDKAILTVPAPAQPHYRTLLTSALMMTYLSLRGMNLHTCPGGPDKFFAMTEVREMLGAAEHINKTARKLLIQAKPGDYLNATL